MIKKGSCDRLMPFITEVRAHFALYERNLNITIEFMFAGINMF